MQVVAEEVRKLAEESSKAVTNIQETIIKVQKAFENLSENSKDILNFVKENVDPQFESMRCRVNITLMQNSLVICQMK